MQDLTRIWQDLAMYLGNKILCKILLANIGQDLTGYLVSKILRKIQGRRSWGGGGLGGLQPPPIFRCFV